MIPQQGRAAPLRSPTRPCRQDWSRPRRPLTWASDRGASVPKSACSPRGCRRARASRVRAHPSPGSAGRSSMAHARERPRVAPARNPCNPCRNDARHERRGSHLRPGAGSSGSRPRTRRPRSWRGAERSPGKGREAWED